MSVTHHRALVLLSDLLFSVFCVLGLEFCVRLLFVEQCLTWLCAKERTVCRGKDKLAVGRRRMARRRVKKLVVFTCDASRRLLRILVLVAVSLSLFHLEEPSISRSLC